MIRTAFQTPELAFTAIGIAVTICLLFICFVVYHSRRQGQKKELRETGKRSDPNH